jgi:hypothetical protein
MSTPIKLLVIGIAPFFLNCDFDEKRESNIQSVDSLYINRTSYLEQLEGFWLGTSIANWTGLVTEMDKIGNTNDISTLPFYTREDWGQMDKPAIWDGENISQISNTIDFVLRTPGELWGADDDTDIEYMYQHLILKYKQPKLNPRQIRDGWLEHISSIEENYLWVSNQQALDLMNKGYLPPDTGDPRFNEHYEMIDAQLTTEIFGLFAPGNPDVARDLASLPIQTVARNEAEDIAQFYVTMFSLASLNPEKSIHDRIDSISSLARDYLPDDEYPARMYDYIRSLYELNLPWEATRDSIYKAYQIEQRHGYEITSKNLYCNGCFAAGINFAASLVSLFYGEGDLLETIKIGSLAGWDSDNPTATWGGLIGFMMGASAIEKAFETKLSNEFHIHRTRQNFPNNGIDTFENMAKNGLKIVESVILNEMNGSIDQAKNNWIIPYNHVKE